MERLNFLIDSLNKAAAKYHLENNTGMEVKFYPDITKTVHGNDMEVALNIWVEYGYPKIVLSDTTGIGIKKILVKQMDLVKSINWNKKSIEEYHVHADLVTRCYQELINIMVLGIDSYDLRKIITGDAIINPFANSPEPYYGKTFNDIIKEKFKTAKS